MIIKCLCKYHMIAWIHIYPLCAKDLMTQNLKTFKNSTEIFSFQTVQWTPLHSHHSFILCCNFIILTWLPCDSSFHSYVLGLSRRYLFLNIFIPLLSNNCPKWDFIIHLQEFLSFSVFNTRSALRSAYSKLV